MKNIFRIAISALLLMNVFGICNVCAGGNEQIKKKIASRSDVASGYVDYLHAYEQDYYVAYDKKHKYALFDSNGHKLTDFEYDLIMEGAYLILVMKGNKKGVCSASGACIVPVKFDYISRYKETDMYEVKQGKHYGVYAVGKGLIVPCKYTGISIRNYYEGNIEVKRGKNYGIISTEGKVLVPCKYSLISASEADFEVKDHHGKYGVYHDGKLIVPVKYSYITVNNGWYSGRTKKDEYNESLFVKQNKKIYTSSVEIEMLRRYDKIERKGDWYSVLKNDVYGACDKNGKEIIAPYYDHIYGNNQYFYGRKNGYDALLNRDGKVLIGIDRKYTSISVNYRTGDIDVVRDGTKRVCSGTTYREISAPKEPEKKKPQPQTQPQQQVRQQTVTYPVYNTTPTQPQRDTRTYQTEYYQENCSHCYGSGRCMTCGGNGTYPNPYGTGYVACPNCDSHQNGRCKFCHGTGKVTKTRYVYK